jgi:hypothetical protein
VFTGRDQERESVCGGGGEKARAHVPRGIGGGERGKVRAVHAVAAAAAVVGGLPLPRTEEERTQRGRGGSEERAAADTWQTWPTRLRGPARSVRPGPAAFCLALICVPRLLRFFFYFYLPCTCPARARAGDDDADVGGRAASPGQILSATTHAAAAAGRGGGRGEAPAGGAESPPPNACPGGSDASIPGRHGRASASLPYTIHRPAHARHETAGTRLKDGDGVRRTRGRASVSRRGSAAVATTRAFGPVRRAGTNRSPSALRALTARRCRRNIHPISPVSTFSSTGRTYGLRLTPSATRYLASSYTDFFSFHRNI